MDDLKQRCEVCAEEATREVRERDHLRPLCTWCYDDLMATIKLKEQVLKMRREARKK